MLEGRLKSVKKTARKAMDFAAIALTSPAGQNQLQY
jgi:hypothetical protein